MSKQLTKEQLVRSAWLTELRRQGHRQCTGLYFLDSAAGRYVCALGLLIEIAVPKNAQTLVAKHGTQGSIGELAGLSPYQTDQVVQMNDGDRIGQTCDPMPFAAIADEVERWFADETL